ncbi:UvrB/UvrC motif-containing protein [Mucisphaera calidilacus]|uniref:UvrB/uvrC motif protein n=1 Tax=Mucisphaera calidilacus TaxID=2527982 RepID=A0A518BV31_9BACT|nr:UvrB/UvrC motif-containing protein [Mucisphaera calidilacus]QDU70845.1 UvrB/uvrC motif protein [Mucisphaera calidilacus]
MKRKCDKCDRPATHHAIEITGGQKIEKHLCDLHAAEEGMSVKAMNAPINDLLTSFVKLQPEEDQANAETVCEGCGMTFSQFREKHLLGCPMCYEAFEHQLSPLLERAHEGGTHHVGKVPRRAGASDNRQLQLIRMRKRLDDAVATEDYELAARLRDDIQQLEDTH